MNRFFVDEKINRDQELKIEGDNFHHCITVLKHKIGDNIVIFDNTESEYHCKIIGIKKHHFLVEIQYLMPKKEAGPRIQVYQCMPKGKTIEDIIEKSVELGVSILIPVVSERTIKKSKEVKERWLDIIESATKQCGRNDFMKISEPISFFEIFGIDDSDLKIIFYENSENRMHNCNFRAKDVNTISIIIGPEGGFSQKEVALAKENDFEDISLGNTVLKSTTALILGVGLIKMVVNNN
ncbi:MAG: RsmE family RNA methyltransferase [Thermodesulfobacteriota bacterium]|nr:RsmE family RNA methyltransferase [Thermodesulfobacteriota bacterium]|tara:strand:- start:6834 stop:7547 length:714 start_codon:yes stop_codon:yes gene_type:complete